MDQNACPFCRVATPSIAENEFAVAVADAYPVAEGHALVIPRRHVSSLFELPELEQTGLWNLVALVHSTLKSQLHPDGFNIGVNDGVAAGQTVMHAHVHVIPRRTGDAADPRGGVRWVLPDKARYWAEGQA